MSLHNASSGEQLAGFVDLLVRQAEHGQRDRDQHDTGIIVRLAPKRPTSQRDLLRRALYGRSPLPYSAPMAGRIPALRAAAVMTAAALGVHELRYLIGYGGEAGSTLAAQGHGYLAFAGAATAALLAAAVAGLLSAMARAHRTSERDGGGLPFGVLWLSASIALALIYCSQELLEGVLAPGHPVGLAGVIATGGWTAFPLSLALGLAVALLLRGADAAIAAAARRRAAPAAASRPVGPLRPLRSVLAPPPSVLALNLAGRAPPAGS